MRKESFKNLIKFWFGQPQTWFLEEDTVNIPVKFVARINFRYSLCNVQHINALLVGEHVNF